MLLEGMNFFGKIDFCRLIISTLSYFPENHICRLQLNELLVARGWSKCLVICLSAGKALTTLRLLDASFGQRPELFLNPSN